MSKKTNTGKVSAKKSLGQHFLINDDIAYNIAGILPFDYKGSIVEIGPGMGVLTKFLYATWQKKLHLVEIDKESVAFLNKQNWAKDLQIIEADWLKIHSQLIESIGEMAVIGNFPYNISTQIAFTAIENPTVQFFGGMFQKEVAKRLCANHGNKEYGVTSILLQTFFNCEYCFDVGPHEFDPPPKVMSGVIACTRKQLTAEVHYPLLKELVKTAFNQRRKTMANALKPLLYKYNKFILPNEIKPLRAEQISVNEWHILTNELKNSME